MAATKSRNETPNTPTVSESKIARMKADDLRRELKNRGVKGTADLKKPELVKKLVKVSLKQNPTSGNDTPNTPTVSESKIARMKVDELRRELKNRGVKGTEDLKKPDLVKKLTKVAVKQNPTRHNDTPNTPSVNESKIARMKVDELRRELKNRGVKGTEDLKKPDLVKKLIKAELAESKSSRSGGSGRAGGSGRSDASGGKRLGKKMSPSLKYAQEIKSTADRPERAGRSLVTTDHAVIQQWAKARRAVPATVRGSEHDGHLGVLRFDFPGYSGDRLTEVSWDDWLEAFDKRRLNFIYQQRLSNGKRSNFFQLENPDE